jgi:hypothetical protein
VFAFIWKMKWSLASSNCRYSLKNSSMLSRTYSSCESILCSTGINPAH